MKKAFDANVSRARPRLRLGGDPVAPVDSPETDNVEVLAAQPVPIARESGPAEEGAAGGELDEAHHGSTNGLSVAAVAGTNGAHDSMSRGFHGLNGGSPAARLNGGTNGTTDWGPTENQHGGANGASNGDLSAAVKARAAARRPTSDELIQEAYDRGVSDGTEGRAAPGVFIVAEAPVPEMPPRGEGAVARGPVLADPSFRSGEAKSFAPPARGPVAHAEPPPELEEIQSPAPPEEDQIAQIARRERLKSRLKAVRENPRPEPLPETPAAAGVLAVERIATLQVELNKARELNLKLTQDLEGARRQAERATEEARSRMDEAKRLAGEMETRAALLSELEAELESLEAERNEALVAVQDARRHGEAQEKEKIDLAKALEAKDKEVEECLAEEERMALELESSRKAVAALRRSTEVLTQERDTLARQVAELTRERTELLEARKALEAVHRALSSATVR
jgi:hypothetical protein